MARSLLNLENTQTRNLTVVMVLVIGQSSTLKFLFVFGIMDKQLWSRFCPLSKTIPPIHIF